MIRSVNVLSMQLPRPVSEHDYKEEEEDAGDFQHDDAAHAPQRAEESTESLRRSSGSASHLASAGAIGSRPADSCYRDRSTARCSGDSLTCEASRNAKRNAQHPANGLRSHAVYDGNSGAEKWACSLRCIALR